MADYKGKIRFIGENAEWALVKEWKLIEDVETSTGIGTGNGSNEHFTGTLTTIVEEGELVIKVAGAQKNASDSDGVITGSDITTSTGKVSTINYATGAIEIYFTVAATPGMGEAVTVVYQYSNTPNFFDGHRLVKGNFSGKAVDDMIYYDYDADASLKDGYYVSETYRS